MKSKIASKTILGIVLFLLVVLSFNYPVIAQESNICADHPNRMWAWTLEGAWMSTNKTGNWKTDNWFYMLKPGEPVVVTQIDGKLDYYLVCYDFGSDDGWQAIYGWVKKENILLQSEITPMP